jgi:deoxyribose-phosphate aldolase
MTLDEQFKLVEQELLSTTFKFSHQQLISVIDLTNLNLDATPNDILALGHKAHDCGVAAVCVYPQHLDRLPANLPLTRAAVVNFPTGDESKSHVINEIHQIATQHHADEIDYVFPYKAYLQGKQDAAMEHCYAAFATCKQHDLLFKVILETGAFNSSDQIYYLSKQIIHSGCDFLKTSTGKIQPGATLPAAFAMLSAIKDSQNSCGIKFSGGIKTPEQAYAYTKLAQYILKKTPENSWFRLGASGLLDVLSCE